MLIDKILDRRDEACEYDPHDFYVALMEYQTEFPEIAAPIARAMDGGTETDVKVELVRYILEQDYNPEIAAFICSVDWLEPEGINKAKTRREKERITRLWRKGDLSWHEASMLLNEVHLKQLEKVEG